MTKVVFVKSKVTGFVSFETKGHSGYSEEGTDIVCSAVSSVTELVINLLDRFKVDFELDIRKDTAEVCCKIKQNSNNSEKSFVIANIVGGYAEYLNELSGVYPEFLKCTISEK